MISFPIIYVAILCTKGLSQLGNFYYLISYFLHVTNRKRLYIRGLAIYFTEGKFERNSRVFVAPLKFACAQHPLRPSNVYGLVLITFIRP